MASGPVEKYLYGEGNECDGCSDLVAANQPVATEIRREGNWFCGPVAAWEQTQIDLMSGAVATNFVFGERASFISSRYRVIEISFSVINRQSTDLIFNSQLVGWDQTGALLFALNVDPIFEVIPSNSVESVSNDIFATSGTITQSTKLCAAFAAEI